MTTEILNDDLSSRTNLIISLDFEDLINRLPNEVYRKAVIQAGRAIAEEIVRTKMDAILARVSPEAMAGLAIAEGANAVKDMLDKKLPDRVEHVVETENRIYLRGFFGNLRRIA